MVHRLFRRTKVVSLRGVKGSCGGFICALHDQTSHSTLPFLTLFRAEYDKRGQGRDPIHHPYSHH